MRSETALLRFRNRILAALLSTSALCGTAGAASTSVQDLGATAAAAPLTATVWLAPRDPAAFERAIAARTEPGSPLYHHWMTDDELAAFGPDTVQVGKLVALFRASNLAVVARDANSLTVSGRAGDMMPVFHTGLRQVARGAQRFRVTTAEPSVGLGYDTMISGITGLDTSPVKPALIRQLDVVTGKPLSLGLATSASDPTTTFTTNCFVGQRTLTLSGSGDTAKLAGPVYTGYLGAPPATKTCGYTAADVAKHYGLDQVANRGFSGQGQTIVIVDAIGSPSILADANTFSKMMGLPALNAGNFTIVAPDGPYVGDPYNDPNADGWPGETSLDVEWAHAIAPKAKIVLVTVPSQADDELIRGVDYAISHRLGQVISNSYGAAEYATGPAFGRSFDTVIARAAAAGIAVNASSGDDGDEGYKNGRGGAEVPAASPHGTAVGGTSLGIPTDAGPTEIGWGNMLSEIDADNLAAGPITSGYGGEVLSPAGFYAGSGGGQSVYLSKPSFQKGLTGSGRLVPDIAAIADPFTGGIFISPDEHGDASVVGVVGGTSLACPVFSAMWAIANQIAGQPLGQAAPILYRLPAGAISDILQPTASASNLKGSITVSGSTSSYLPADLLGIAFSQPTGFVGTAAPFDIAAGQLGAVVDLGFGTDTSLQASAGWDNVTGLGVPNGLAFFQGVAGLK